jgi:hypothetical protein
MLIRTPDHGDAQVWNIEGTRLGTHVLIRANNLPPELDAALVESAQGYVSRLGSDYGPSHVSPAYGIKKFVA